MKRELEPYQMIERSIIKKYRKELWTPFIVTVKRYELVQEGDKIAVCISGGKDSMLMAKLMQELQKHSDVPFELVFLVMDPGYNEINRQKIESNAELLHIPDAIERTITITPTKVKRLLVPHILNGELAIELPGMAEKKAYIAKQLTEETWETELRIEMPHKHYVNMTPAVAECRAKMYSELHGGKV